MRLAGKARNGGVLSRFGARRAMQASLLQRRSNATGFMN
jgi:hypothetical protein